jgi:hypothetical protein
MRASKKQEIISFKVDAALAHALQAMPNRSEFIRSAVLAALDSGCPLCGGTGTLSSDQRVHWRRFATTHELVECDDCHAFHLVCTASHRQARRVAHPRTSGGSRWD